MHRITVLALLSISCGALAQDGGISFKSTEVAPGLYMLEGQGGFTGGNFGLLTGEDGVILIDTGLDSLEAVTLAAIEEHSGGAVDFVINTHVHGDHVGNNAPLHRHGARIVAHEKLRERMLGAGGHRDALPEVTFADSVTFHLNGTRAHVVHVVNAHTDGDSIIHFTDVNVIHTGDILFNGMFPFIDLDSGGTVDGYIAALRKIVSMADGETKVIPGHGVLATRADVQASADMLADAQGRVKALVDQGKSADEVLAANPLSSYEALNWEFITTERMTQTIYRDLTSSD